MSLAIFLGLYLLINQAYCQRNVTIHGNISIGYYYIDVYVGTPPQRKSLILDTGSRQTVMTCELCEKCGNHWNEPFLVSESQTVDILTKNQTNFDWQCSFSDDDKKCSFRSSYLEGSSYAGYVIKDTFLFRNELNITTNITKTHLFGCAVEETGEFASQAADGIIGFGPYSQETFLESPTLLEVEFRDKRISSKVFSICLGNNGGQLMIGDWNSNRHLPGEQPIYLDSSDVSWNQSYNVELSGIKVK